MRLFASPNGFISLLIPNYFSDRGTDLITRWKLLGLKLKRLSLSVSTQTSVTGVIEMSSWMMECPMIIDWYTFVVPFHISMFPQRSHCHNHFASQLVENLLNCMHFRSMSLKFNAMQASVVSISGWGCCFWFEWFEDQTKYITFTSDLELLIKSHGIRLIL